MAHLLLLPLALCLRLGALRHDANITLFSSVYVCVYIVHELCVGTLQGQMTGRHLDERSPAGLSLSRQVLTDLDNGMNTVAVVSNHLAEGRLVDSFDTGQSLQTDHEEVELVFRDFKVPVQIGPNDSRQEVLHDFCHELLLNLILQNTVLLDEVDKGRHRCALVLDNVREILLNVIDLVGLCLKLRDL